jgi:protein-tyrosine phosphatase
MKPFINKRKNIRDIAYLKGYQTQPIRSGFLIRGGQLNDASKKEMATLSTYHFDFVFDFRDVDEEASHPDKRFEGTQYCFLPPLSLDMPKGASHKSSNEDNFLSLLSSGINGRDYMEKFYRRLVTEESARKAYAKFFETITSKPNARIYWHCSQGKDRAGLAAFLLEYALGVSLNDCISDYLLSNKSMKRRIRTLGTFVYLRLPFGKKKQGYRLISDLFSVRKEYLDQAIQAIDKDYGGLDHFLNDELKVDIKKLRATYLVNK